MYIYNFGGHFMSMNLVPGKEKGYYASSSYITLVLKKSEKK
jgi:hypothetical protein